MIHVIMITGLTSSFLPHSRSCCVREWAAILNDSHCCGSLYAVIGVSMWCDACMRKRWTRMLIPVPLALKGTHNWYTFMIHETCKTNIKTFSLIARGLRADSPHWKNKICGLTNWLYLSCGPYLSNQYRLSNTEINHIFIIIIWMILIVWRS